MKIPLVDGREFNERDGASSPRAMIVNETFVKRFLPGRSPVGGKVKAGDAWFTIVGVVKDSKYINLTESPLPYMYLSFLQRYGPGDIVTIQIRTAGAPASALPTLRREARALDPRAAIFNAMPLTAHIEQSLFAQKLAASLLSALGALALLLAAVGLYSLMAYSVTQRTAEIGVRMALGARPEDVRRMVVRQGIALALAGVALGLAGALALTRLVSRLLLTVSPTDPAVFAGAAAFLTAVALAASYLPALRATRVDPMTALRCQ
jgi:putative ABC transport system permease protein